MMCSNSTAFRENRDQLPLVYRYPEYVLQHIHLLPTKDPQRSLKAAMLLYASFLIKMHNMSSKALEKEGIPNS